MVIIQSINPETPSVWELLPSDLIKLILVQSRNPIMFRVCKLFNSYSNDEDFWKNYAKIVSNYEFPPKHFKEDSRVSTAMISSWKSYVRSLIAHKNSCAPQAGPMVRKRLLKELKDMCPEIPEEVSAGPMDDNNIMHWVGAIQGPKGTPYEGGLFFVDIKFPINYPCKPPKIYFTTKIYSCEINSRGNHCLSILADNWSPAITGLSDMIANPNPDDPMVPEIAHVYKRNREQHDKIAAEWTKKYAM